MDGWMDERKDEWMNERSEACASAHASVRSQDDVGDGGKDVVLLLLSLTLKMVMLFFDGVADASRWYQRKKMEARLYDDDIILTLH